MLGKGLESLIPPPKPTPSSGALSQPSLPPKPFLLEIDPPEQEELLESPKPPDGLPIGEELQDFLPESPVAPIVPTVTKEPESFDVQTIAAQYGARPAKGRGEAVFYLEVDKIHPNAEQPRRHFDDEALGGLAASIREFGVLQPIVVTKIQKEVQNGTEVEYELIAGERRLMASKLAGLERIPAIIKVVDVARNRLELAVIENLQRENLSAIEMARSFARLQDEFRMTQREIAARLGKSREVVANTMRLLDLPSYIQEAIEKGQMSESHGRLLLAIEDPAAQQALFHDLLNQHLTTRELRQRLAFLKNKKPSARDEEEHLPVEMKEFEDRLTSGLGAPVSIKAHGGGGKITIDFYSPEELAQIVDRLGQGE